MSVDRTMTPVAEGLFTGAGGEVRLIGSRCAACGVIAFPRQGSCPRCTSLDVREHLLSRSGTLWSWTIQCFRPKSPPYAAGASEPFEPYGVGYVELDGELRIESLLTESDPDRLQIGMPMELTLIPAPGSGTAEVLTYAFRPLEADR
jgi:uncharacterized OB-fold protein